MKKIGLGCGALLALMIVTAGAAWMWKYRLLALGFHISQPVYARMKVQEDLKVPMRDGVSLATDVYLPDAGGTFPAILIRLPYGKNAARSAKLGKRMQVQPALIFTQRGYALVIQDTRGRYDSEGEFYAFRDERSDGEDVLKWLKTQPWFNGTVGCVGGSYFGYTQWALAPEAQEEMKCMMPMIISSNIYDCMYRQGAFSLLSCGGWSVDVGSHRDGDGGSARWDEARTHLPLKNVDDVALRDVAFFDDWLAHPRRDLYWDEINLDDDMADVKAPALLFTGWYDLFVGEQLKDYTRLKERAGSGDARRPRLVVGPWAHGSSDGDMDFGPEGGSQALVKILVKEAMDWNDYWLRRKGTLNEKPVRIFVSGTNVWRDEEDWPLARAKVTNYYIHSSGNANSSKGEGILDEKACAAGEATDGFVYDPDNPVPTVGGCLLGPNMGCRDQKDVEAREDVLIYTSNPLEEGIEVTGPIRFVLYASSSAVDTDFTVKLCDVTPEGKSLNLQEGIVRGRFRKAGVEELLVPGQAYEFEIDMWATSHVFQQGHRMRVQISSSNFPQFDRNLNMGGDFAEETTIVKADQIIYHDQDRPSHIVLPVIPGH